MITVGTRPEIIRLSETIKKAQKYFNVILVHTGQNYDYELNKIFFDEFGLKEPDYYLDSPGETLGDTIGNIISRSYNLMSEVKPGALLILGDTNSSLTAYSAKRHKIPIFHMEAGNRCFDENVPEETNRRIADHISDVNLCYTENARRYLLAEGIGKDYVYVTGSPMAEVLKANEENIAKSDVHTRLGIEKGRYFVISMHREENVDTPESLRALTEALNVAAGHYSLPMIFSTHPRTKKRIEEACIQLDPLIKTMPPLGFADYNKLQKDAFCVLSDSGTVSEESFMLGFPAVSMRTSQERPEALDAGAIILGGKTKETILDAIEIAAKGGHKEGTVKDYTDLNVSEKVCRIIASYIPIINERIWKKHT
jgi:UDP-N-acetylglucosamine 2-epimerase (non-hydrolysing)